MSFHKLFEGPRPLSALKKGEGKGRRQLPRFWECFELEFFQQRPLFIAKGKKGKKQGRTASRSRPSALLKSQRWIDAWSPSHQPTAGTEREGEKKKKKEKGEERFLQPPDSARPSRTRKFIPALSCIDHPPEKGKGRKKKRGKKARRFFSKSADGDASSDGPHSVPSTTPNPEKGKKKGRGSQKPSPNSAPKYTRPGWPCGKKGEKKEKGSTFAPCQGPPPQVITSSSTCECR